MLVSGPSKCGKTYFVSSLLNNLETVCVKPPSKVIWVYTNEQAAHASLRPFVTQFIDVQDFKDSGEDEIQTYLLKTMKDLTGPGGHGLLIFDDCHLLTPFWWQRQNWSPLSLWELLIISDD